MGSGLAEAGTRARPGVDKIALWNSELLDELLPVQDEPGAPVVLACDDETLRAVGERLGYDATETAKAFAQEVKIAFDIGRLNGFKYSVSEPFDKVMIAF
jgi:hypothetical protein